MAKYPRESGKNRGWEPNWVHLGVGKFTNEYKRSEQTIRPR